MTIGLIAMSGVRAHNPELTKLGLTLPGFVERNRTIASLPSLGLLTLAGLTPDDISLEYLEVPDLATVTGLPGEFDLVAISSFTAQMPEAYRLADRYRAAGTRVVLGGLHATALPDEAAQHADAVVAGEGEIAWPRLLADWRRGTLQPLYDVRQERFDFCEAPMPRFELLEIDRYNRLTVQTQRGCPWRCEFCAASIRLSPVFKVKPIDRVMAEIRRIKGIWPNPFVEFADDNTFVNKAHGKALLRALASAQVRWFTETDISVADDPELLGLMRDSGCAQVLVGLESPSRTGLDGLEQRANWKPVSLTATRRRFAAFRITGSPSTAASSLALTAPGPTASRPSGTSSGRADSTRSRSRCRPRFPARRCTTGSAGRAGSSARGPGSSAPSST